MQGVKIKKLRASSLIENLVAMTIISIVMGIGFSLFVHISKRQAQDYKMLFIHSEINNYFRAYPLNTSIHNWNENHFKLKFHVHTKGLDEHLRKVTVIAYDIEDTKLYERTRTFYIN
jgi:hypothetical protein